MAGDDHLIGYEGRDTLYGSSGRDTLDGGTGGDLLDGGAGIDTASYAYATKGVQLSLAAGVGFYGEASGDRFVGIENAIGSAFNDSIAGDAGRNEFWGGGGNDCLTGAAGRDLLHGDDGEDHLSGGLGNDILYGGVGADNLDGGTGSDTASYFYADTGVSVDLAAGTAGGGEATGDVLDNVENLSGSEFDDVLTGDGYGNTMLGYGGNDTIKGNASNDVLLGDAGNDHIEGGYGADLLNGGSGNDVLRGDISVDTLIGSLGLDVMSGGADGDTFVFASTSDSGDTIATADRIRDFEHGRDKVDLSRIDAWTHGSADDAFLWIGGDVFSGQDGEIRAYDSGGNTYLAADIDGDATADFLIRFDGNVTLASTDFFL